MLSLRDPEFGFSGGWAPLLLQRQGLHQSLGGWSGRSDSSVTCLGLVALKTSSPGPLLILQDSAQVLPF